MTESRHLTPPRIRRQVQHDEIARRARELWEAHGHPVGRDEQIWLEAERELRGLDLRNAGAATPNRAPADPHGSIALQPSRRERSACC